MSGQVHASARRSQINCPPNDAGNRDAGAGSTGSGRAPNAQTGAGSVGRQHTPNAESGSGPSRGGATRSTPGTRPTPRGEAAQLPPNNHYEEKLEKRPNHHEHRLNPKPKVGGLDGLKVPPPKVKNAE